MPTFTTSTSRRWCNWVRRPISTPPSSTLSTLSRSSTSSSAASWHRYRNSLISWPARIARVAPRITGNPRPPPTCVTGLVDFEYTLLLSHCCEDILGSGHLLQGHVSHVSIAEFYPCSPFYYYAHFFSSTSMSFYLLAMLSNGRLFFRLYFIVNLSFNKFFFPCHLMILFCSNYLKTSHSQYILCIKIFGHFEISNKSLLSFSYQSSFKITYTWLVLHMYCILSITISCFSSCLFFG